jgi:hypothetical protein
MRISIQQPEYLPWLGYLDKIRQVNLVVLLDNVQFKKRYFENRNKIRTATGWQWIGIPVITKGRYHQKICDVKIDNTQNWRDDCWKALFYNYKKALYWKRYEKFFKKIYQRNWIKLVDFNVEVMKFGLKKKILLASELNIKGEGDVLLLNTCRKIGATEYLSGGFGKNYINENLFKKAGIALLYQDFKHPIYKQLYEPFIPEMSSIDLLFNYGPESLSILTKKYEKS